MAININNNNNNINNNINNIINNIIIINISIQAKGIPPSCLNDNKIVATRTGEEKRR